MSSPFDNLDESKVAQVIRYLRFFRSKKDGLIRVVTREADEARADKLIHEKTIFKRRYGRLSIFWFLLCEVTSWRM